MSTPRIMSPLPFAVAGAVIFAGFLGFVVSGPGAGAARDGAITAIPRASPPMAFRTAAAPPGRAAPNDAVHGGAGAPAEGGAPGTVGGRAAPNDAVHGGAARPPMAGMGGGAPVETDGDEDLPLKKTGINSRAELDRGRAAATTDEARAAFERGFRLTFTTRQDRRGYQEALTLLRRAIDLEPKLAEAYRALGYAVFNTGGGFEGAIPLYEKAVAIRGDYGEAHYALAFFLGESDLTRGREHFRRSKELGVPDERGLGPRYYPDVR